MTVTKRLGGGHHQHIRTGIDDGTHKFSLTDQDETFIDIRDHEGSQFMDSSISDCSTQRHSSYHLMHLKQDVNDLKRSSTLRTKSFLN